MTERRHPYLFFGLAALSLFMFSIDRTVVSVALPNMMDDLQTSLVWVGWTLTAYLLTQTAVMPLAGKLSESFGRMRVFLVCVFLFTLGSLLCGIAPNIYVLIACRVIQAIGGGGFLPSAAGIVAREFPTNRDRMIGLFSSIFPLGGIVGPNLGGFIVERWSMARCVPDQRADGRAGAAHPVAPGRHARTNRRAARRRCRRAAVCRLDYLSAGRPQPARQRPDLSQDAASSGC